MADGLTGTVMGPFRFCSHGFYEQSLASVWNLNRVDQRTPANLQLSLARRPFYMTICFWEILWGRRTEFCADDVRTVYRWSPIQSLNTHGASEIHGMIEELMITHGNGDLVSDLIYAAINRDYRDRVTNYMSFCDSTHQRAHDYPEKDGEWLTRFPPLGETIRKAYLEASQSTWNPWRLSDKDRHTREIQAVKCSTSFAQDHTYQVVKNYPKRIQAEALFDCCNEHGEVLLAVLVKSTETKHFSHAATQLAKRPGFRPSIMYSDTFPHKKGYWEELLGKGKEGNNVQGRLGLFHFIRRITKTMRPSHIDYGDAMRDLLDCLYEYDDGDFGRLVTALKNGEMSATGEKYSDKGIAEMRQTKTFRQRYGKYLRKKIRGKQAITTKLEEWKTKYKVRASEGSSPARGRLDPRTQQSLFTAETHQAIENCKNKAEFLSDPLPTKKMYLEIKAHPNSKHGLSEFVSYRGESKLESWHDNLAHFGNGGMNEALSDVLNLCGTARYNKKIRQNVRLANLNSQQRNKNMPAAWEGVVSHWNHCELAFINKLAVRCGAKKPFDYVEDLPDDNGERFFSEYLSIQTEIQQQWPLQFFHNDHCPCNGCSSYLHNKTQLAIEEMRDDHEDNNDDNNNGQHDEEDESDEEQDMNEEKEKEKEKESDCEDINMAEEEGETNSMQAESSPVAAHFQPAKNPNATTTTTNITMPPTQQQMIQPQAVPSMQHNQTKVYHYQQQLLQQAAFLSTILCQQTTAVPNPAHQQILLPNQPPPQFPPQLPTNNCCIRNIQYWNRPNRRGIPPHDKSCRNHASNRLC